MSTPNSHAPESLDQPDESSVEATEGPKAPEQGHLAVPELPRALTDIWPVIAAGSGLWLIAFIAMLTRYLFSDGPADIWLWTTMSGVAISAIGIGILVWQRAAARRGSRSAQKVL